MKKLIITYLFLTTLTGLSAITSVYDYLSSKPEPYTVQSTSDLWTFHSGDQNAVLLPILQSDGYGNGGPDYAFFGIPRAALSPDTAGTAGNNEAPGIFVHSSSNRAITAVYTVPAPMTVEALLFTYELVINGNLGNGIDFNLRTVRGGTVVDYASIPMTSTSSQQATIPLTGADTFAAGDQIIAVFSNRGDVLYDHGWFNLESTTVPEPSSGLLTLLAGIMFLRRKR